MSILVTGGAGYIGSHTCLELINAGHEVVVVDNLANSSKISLDRVSVLTGKQIPFWNVDMLDKDHLNEVFLRHNIEAVIHFAGFKAVGESVKQPLRYYHNNLMSTINLCEVMERHNVRNLVFSSSATVYASGNHSGKHSEEDPLGVTNPYGRSKLMIEEILHDLYVSNSSWSISLLRYFNPVGAHPTGRIGEDPAGLPNNLMPYITQVAAGKLPYLNVFGDDYPTNDGTGVRDYIHVVDLSLGHLKAIEWLRENTGIHAFNLGTGRGYSVLEMISAFEVATGTKIAYKKVQRRPGDIAICYADPSKAERLLKWKAERGIEEMCADAWRWQVNNPNGYTKETVLNIK
jgi:UDP-glucose 4-epimerase